MAVGKREAGQHRRDLASCERRCDRQRSADPHDERTAPEHAFECVSCEGEHLGVAWKNGRRSEIQVGDTEHRAGRERIAQKPLYDDCRWKTQNVTVHDNTFTFDPAHLGCTQFCGRMAVLSNYGSYPDWSPYKGDVVQQAITFGQNNHFSDNTYSGPWMFVAHDTSRVLTPEQWQAGPYGQDQGSKF